MEPNLSLIRGPVHVDPLHCSADPKVDQVMSFKSWNRNKKLLDTRIVDSKGCGQQNAMMAGCPGAPKHCTLGKLLQGTSPQKYHKIVI